jgi:rare lipoprotein A
MKVARGGLSGIAWVRGAFMLAVLAALAACGEASDGTAGRSAGGAQTTQLVETDIEAPEVFQVTGQGLWDGRPSLGGVWVAHPDVRDPERVIVRNQDNGSFVIGALFRRERANPGPELQVSSDAASALGMLAGAPAMLNVTALRRQEATVPAPTEATAPVAVPDGEEVPVAAALATDAVATTTLAGAPVVPAPAPAPNGDPAAATAVAAATSAILDGAPAPAAAAPAAASSLDRPFIQLGIFSVEANAESLAREMTAKGLPARVAASRTQGQAFWRVLVGPAGTEAERQRFLDRVKAEGFADAYAVRN